MSRAVTGGTGVNGLKQVSPYFAVGVWAPLDFGGWHGGGDFIARKKYIMPESMSVHVQMHSNGNKNKNNSHV